LKRNPFLHAALGGAREAWTGAPMPGDDHFTRHVLGGIESAMGRKPFCR
jgi:hypothetical protein